MSNVRPLVKVAKSFAVALIAGFVLAWLSVHLSGVLSSLSWPAFMVAMAKESRLAAAYFWGVIAHFAPMFVFAFAGGLLLFRVVGANIPALVASLVPYFLLYALLGSASWLRSSPSIASLGLVALGIR